MGSSSHGTDTLAYTASAMSFMLEGLHKPVILTGSQLPIGLPRTDGRENLLSAVEIASAHRLDAPIVQEVAVYFGSSLYRGNRTHKASAESMQAIISPNLPPLAEAGVDIQFNDGILFRDPLVRLNVHETMESCIAWLPLFRTVCGNFETHPRLERPQRLGAFHLRFRQCAHQH